MTRSPVRWRSEQGVALVVAIGVLLVMGILAVTAAAIALEAKRNSGAQKSSVRALAAAESALRLGTTYLNQATPISDGQCPGTAANGVATKTAATDTAGNPGKGYGGRCGPYSVTMADGTVVSMEISGGATYTTGVSSGTLACSGAQVNAPSRPGLDIHQRCITATATVQGVTRRAQARVASASYIFPVPGIVGIEHVKIGQGAGSTLTLSQCASPSTLPAGTGLIMASVGTNGTLTTSLGCWLGDPSDATLGNSARLYLGAGHPATTQSGDPNPSITGAQPGGIIKLSTKLELPALDSLFQAGQDGVTDSSLPGGNRNTTGIRTGASCTTTAYTASTRLLALAGQGCVVTLDGSNDAENPAVYNFCNIDMPKGDLKITDPAANPYVRVYLDSPSRLRADGTAACPSTTTGTLTMANGTTILADAPTSLAAQVFIYGTAAAPGTLTNDISWRNGPDVKLLLVAPRARILFQNQPTITGGIAAHAVEINNGSKFIWDRDVDKVERRALYYRSSYTECARVRTVSTDPHSGC